MYDALHNNHPNRFYYVQLISHINIYIYIYTFIYGMRIHIININYYYKKLKSF